MTLEDEVIVLRAENARLTKFVRKVFREVNWQNPKTTRDKSMCWLGAICGLPDEDYKLRAPYVGPWQEDPIV